MLFYSRDLKTEIKQEEGILFLPLMHFTVSATIKRIHQLLVPRGEKKKKKRTLIELSLFQ